MGQACCASERDKKTLGPDLPVSPENGTRKSSSSRPSKSSNDPVGLLGNAIRDPQAFVGKGSSETTALAKAPAGIALSKAPIPCYMACSSTALENAPTGTALPASDQGAVQLPQGGIRAADVVIVPTEPSSDGAVCVDSGNSHEPSSKEMPEQQRREEELALLIEEEKLAQGKFIEEEKLAQGKRQQERSGALTEKETKLQFEQREEAQSQMNGEASLATISEGHGLEQAQQRATHQQLESDTTPQAQVPSSMSQESITNSDMPGSAQVVALAHSDILAKVSTSPRKKMAGSLSDMLAARRSVVELEGSQFESNPQCDLPREPVALMFPDQDTIQKLGIIDKAQNLPAVSSMLDRAHTVLGYDLRKLCSDGPMEELGETRKSQVAVYVAGLAAVEMLRERSIEASTRPAAVCGLGVGEYAALVVAGVFDFERGLRLVQLRADAMYEASIAHPEQTQILVMGLSLEEGRALCEEALSASAEADISPGRHHVEVEVCQVSRVVRADCCFIAGTTKSVSFAYEMVKKRGPPAKANFFDNPGASGIGAFQTPCMTPAQKRLRTELQKLLPSLKPPVCDVYFNATGMPLPAGSSPGEVARLLALQLTSTALWEPSLRGLSERGFEKYYDMASGGKIKEILRKVSMDAWRKTNAISI